MTPVPPRKSTSRPWWFEVSDDAFFTALAAPESIAAGDLVNVDLGQCNPSRRGDVFLVDEGFGPTLRFVRRVKHGFALTCPNAAIETMPPPTTPQDVRIIGRALRVRRRRPDGVAISIPIS